jgi:hypothetical protein
MAWWENDGSEYFVKHTLYEDDYGVKSVHATDVDGDGDVDILGATIHGGCDEIIWWENDGEEAFTEQIIDGCFGANRIDATDVDGDGDVDVLGASGGSNEIVWWEQGKPLTLTFLPIAQRDAGPVSEAPVLDDISNPDGNGDYTVSWSAVHRATSYTLQEDDHAGFSSPVVAYSGAYTSTHITGRDVETYYYRVNASNAFGSSDWSQVKSVEVTVPPTPPPCPDPGQWSGDTDQGYPIDFTVTSDCQVWDLTIEYVVTCPTGIMWKTRTFDYSTPISDDDFEYDADGDPTVSGHFSSSTAANGIWSSSFYLPGIGTCTGSGTWSANIP